MSYQDFVFQNMLGMDKAAFLRKAGLMRNPEGFEKPGYCPICKKELRQNDQGDLYCTDWNPGYEKEGGCYWHRYADGLNYWSEPEEIFKVMAENDPEFKKMYDQAKSRL
jgi:hypothetical protein